LGWETRTRMMDVSDAHRLVFGVDERVLRVHPLISHALERVSQSVEVTSGVGGRGQQRRWVDLLCR
jgi:hypothetical protein